MSGAQDIAHDSTVPGDKKATSVVERANGVAQMGTRATLFEAGLPPPFWTYAVRYFCLCINVQQDTEGDSPWRKRFGSDFQYPLLPLGSLMRYMHPPESRFRVAKTGSTMVTGLFLGFVHKAGGVVDPDSYAVPFTTAGWSQYGDGPPLRRKATFY